MKEIQLTRGKVALVDDSDYAEVSKYKWCAQQPSPNHWYAVSRIEGKVQLLHRFLLKYPPGDIDHKDGDGLNNARANLRVCSPSQNHMNRKKRRGCSSRFKGVHWYKARGQWQAYIMKDTETRFLGYFSHETEAALAYDRAAIELFGEFARLNFSRGGLTTPTFLFAGLGRSGKDTSAEIFAKITGLRYAGSFSWHAIPFMSDFLKIHPMTAWATRHEHRQIWKDRLDYLRRGDETLLAELALSTGEITTGVRDHKELEAIREKKLFTRVFWVERPGTPPDPTVTFTKEDCDEIIFNDGGLVHLHSKLFLIAEKYGLIQGPYLSGKAPTKDRFRD